ncbi:AEC family transporter [Eubacteriales bacterium OttesenSCG-928-N14]|nr:AEC family transporter [Eubacteriales bacterium OttesenSCG-928-N14]
MFENTLTIIITLFGLMLIGMAIAKKPWFAGGTDLLSALLTKVIMPVNVFYTVMSSFDFEGPFTQTLLLELCVVLIFLISVATGVLSAKIAKTTYARTAVFIASVGFPNMLLLGYPVVQASLGESAMRYAVLYSIAGLILFWFVSTSVLIKYGQPEGKRGRLLTPANLKKIFSPSLIMLLFGIALKLIGFSIPNIFGGAILRVAQSTLAISMIFIGAVIRNVDLKSIALSRDLIVVLVTKFIIMPAILLGMLNLLPLERTVKMVFFLLSVMPMSVNFSVLAYQYKCDYSFTAVVAAMSNLLCIVAIPLYVFLLETFPALLG